MTNIVNVSFNDLGWGFYYDIDGKYPMSQDENLSYSPGEEITLFYRCPPVQEEDGKFYGYDIYSNDTFPLFFFGLYNQIEKYNTIELFGEEDTPSSINGKVESYSLWNNAIDDASVVAYQTNTMKMIGVGAEYMYQDLDEANESGLYSHFDFDTFTSVTLDHKQEVTSLKPRNFELGSGKTTNSSIMNRLDDFIRVDGSKFFKEFTLNFRFFIEELGDFTLFKADEILKISFDEVTSSFNIEVYPYAGNIVYIYIEKYDIRVHHWYDFAVKFDGSMMKVFIDGEMVEENHLNLEISGAYNLELRHDNIEYIRADSTFSSNAHVGPTTGNYISPSTFFNYLKAVKRDGYNYLNREATLSAGARNIYSLIGGKDGSSLAIPLGGNNPKCISHDIDPDDPEKKTISWIWSINAEHSEGSAKKTFIAKQSDGSVNAGMTECGNCGSMSGNTFWSNGLQASGYIKVTIKIKDTVSNEDPIFPMIFSLPGMPVIVKKVELGKMDEISSIYCIKSGLELSDMFQRYGYNPSVYTGIRDRHSLGIYNFILNGVGVTLPVRHVFNDNIMFYSNGNASQFVLMSSNNKIHLGPSSSVTKIYIQEIL